MACSMARRMHSWSYSGLAMLVTCHVCGALLPLDEKMTSSGYSERVLCVGVQRFVEGVGVEFGMGMEGVAEG
jgi:hypothetical protein